MTSAATKTFYSIPPISAQITSKRSTVGSPFATTPQSGNALIMATTTPSNATTPILADWPARQPMNAMLG